MPIITKIIDYFKITDYCENTEQNTPKMSSKYQTHWNNRPQLFGNSTNKLFTVRKTSKQDFLMVFVAQNHSLSKVNV